MDSLSFNDFRVMQPGAPRKKYVRSTEKNSNNNIGLDAVKGLHYGQRKLLLSEIELFSVCWRVEMIRNAEKVVVVYAGAANGSHLPFLFSLFPMLKFVLIDPAPFCQPVQDIAAKEDGPILEIINGYCTGEVCDRLKKDYGGNGSTQFILVSDIRSGNPPNCTNKEASAMITTDNNLQKDFCNYLQPAVAMLKFHPPYPKVSDPKSPYYDPLDDTPDAIEYYDGFSVFGVWPPKSSSEVRLVVPTPAATDVKMKQYDCTEFEEVCYHYNTEDRYQKDVEAEISICTVYLETFGGENFGFLKKPVSTKELIEFSHRISEHLKFPKFTPIEGHQFNKHASKEDKEDGETYTVVDGHMVNRFTEDEARLCALLYDADSIHLFTAEWREKITLKTVRDAVSKLERHPMTIPEDAPQAGDLSREFWQVASFKRLNSFYGVQMPKRIFNNNKNNNNNGQHQNNNGGGRGGGFHRGGGRGGGRGGFHRGRGGSNQQQQQHSGDKRKREEGQ